LGREGKTLLQQQYSIVLKGFSVTQNRWGPKTQSSCRHIAVFWLQRLDSALWRHLNAVATTLRTEKSTCPDQKRLMCSLGGRTCMNPKMDFKIIFYRHILSYTP
jgi:hypothetical protein